MALTLNPTTGKFDVVNNKAVKIKITDAGDYYTGTEVETALQEIGAGTALDDRYVEVTGDTMTGTLNMSNGSHIAMGENQVERGGWLRFFSDDETTGQVQFVPNTTLGHQPFTIKQVAKVLEFNYGNTDFLHINSTGGLAPFSAQVKVFGDLAFLRPDAALTAELGGVSARWNTFMSGMVVHQQTVTAASDTLVDTDCVVLCDCTSNAITINLPTASVGTGKTYHIKKTDSTSNKVTIDGNGTQTIDGSLTKVISSQWDSLMIVSDGSNWYII